ncbi:hypothetical protein DFH28DRAFT_458419 [Melampsora americana]|nr:hypothetical protein DFH28DRAFT_458419 [Melampsora americana]
MSLPPFQRITFEPTELNFITLLTEKIQFIPNVKLPKFRSINSNFLGPFEPLKIIEIPFWISIEFKKKFKGKIICPNWLSINQLKDTLNLEITNQQFSNLPFHWLEMSKILIDIAPDDLPSLPEVRSILKAIREVRQTKLRKGLTGMDGLHSETPNISALEINELRSVFTKSHLNLFQLHPQFDSFSQFDSSQTESNLNFYNQDHPDLIPMDLSQSTMNHSSHFPSTDHPSDLTDSFV